MSKRNKRPKRCKLLTQEQANTLARCEYFSLDAYEYVRTFILIDYFPRKRHNPALNYKVHMELRSLFEEIYARSIDELILSYFERYSTPSAHRHHNEQSFFNQVTSIMYDKLDYALSDGRPTDGFGCIYVCPKDISA